MATVSFLPDKIKVDLQLGETLLQAALRAGIPHINVCGGIGRCSTCRVVVLEGLEHCSPPTKDEEAILEMLKLPPPRPSGLPDDGQRPGQSPASSGGC